MLSSGSRQSVLGLDIGSSAVKVVQLRKEKERAILETYGEIALGPYGNVHIGQSVSLSNDKIVEALKDLLREANVKAKRTAVSIPLKSSFITVINIPVLPDKNISEMIQLEARRYIPVPISEVIIDWWIFPEEEIVEEEKEDKDGRKFMKVLLVAIHKDTISTYKKIVSELGLELENFEIESFSMIRSSVGRDASPVAVVDFGASATNVAIVDLGTMRSSYSVNKGSQDLTLALSSSLGVDFKRAEEMKREIGLSDLPEHKEIVSIMEPILEYVFTEIKSVIMDYQKKNKQSVNHVFITGGGALLKGLIDFSVKHLAVEVTMTDPFLKTEYPAFLGGVLRKTGLSFSVAIGLALRELQ
ncbi:type IV pilus assembly protein PilM [Patescibacteria group bacterium]|nr:type IV pilus assembly protein PilM [Patescibacteria group bacterium]